jgi:hypothetical protein
MKYLTSAKQLTITGVTFALFVILLFTTCRKKEIFHDDLMADYTENFFTVPANASPIIKRVAAAISLQNDRYHFVNDLAKNEGMAFWGNAFILQGNRFLHRDANTATGGDTTVLIPLVLNNTQFVSGYLECKVTDSVSIALVKGREYSNYGYSNGDTTLNAQTIAKVCMAFEYEIWGHNQFVVTNATLARSLFGLTATPRYQVIKVANAPSPNSQAIGIGGYTYTMGDFLQDHQINYWTWWFAQGYNNVNGGNSGNIYPPSGVGGTPSGTTGTGGWYSYPYSGFTHWSAGWQVTTEDAQKINNFTANNIDMTGLDSCRQLILKKLLNTNGINMLGRILTKVDRGVNEPQNVEKFKVTYKLGNILYTDSVAGKADDFTYDPQTKVFTAVIILDSTVAKNSTDLFIAGTLLHETLHAYMGSLLFRVAGNVSLAELKQMGYDSLFSRYVDTLITKTPAQLLNELFQDPEYDHNYWAGNIITKIAEVIQVYDNYKQDFRFYSYLSWKGLYNTHIWKQHWNNYPNLPVTGIYTTQDSTRGLPYALTPTRLDSIHNIVIYNEFVANNNAKGNKPIPGGCY